MPKNMGYTDKQGSFNSSSGRMANAKQEAWSKKTCKQGSFNDSFEPKDGDAPGQSSNKSDMTNNLSLKGVDKFTPFA